MKFIADKEHLFIGFRQLPNYPLSSMKIMTGGIDFDKNREFTTDDEVLITALKGFIEARRGKVCPIWAEGQEQSKAVVEPVYEHIEPVDNEEEFKQFTRLLRL
jgi:hypothetical protein